MFQQVRPREMARLFQVWYPPSKDSDDAAAKARALFAASDDPYYREVEGIIRARGKNRKARRVGKARKVKASSDAQAAQAN